MILVKKILKSKRKVLLKFSLLAVLFLIIFFPTYPHLFKRFAARDSYYSHGFLIPLVSLYLVWRKREVLKRIPKKSNILGIFVFIFGILAHLAGLALKINFFSYAAIPIVMFGIILYLGGGKLTKELLFPIGFLIFMLPLPKVLIIGIAFRMKILAANSAVWLVSNIGMSVRQSGSTIYYPGGSLLVGDPCSGLRSLISFMALGAFFTQISEASLWKKNILFLSAVFIAFISNLIRIVFLFFVSYIYGQKAVSGFLHDSSGIMVFILGFMGFILLSKVLKCQLKIDDI